jgi:IS5 family transposase
MVVTREGIPVEYTFTPGSYHDMQGLRGMPLNLPEGSTLYADAAYTDYTTEEMLADHGIRLLAARKANSKRLHAWVEYLISISRKRIEVSFRDIAKYMPKTIHAVTEGGG